MKNYKLTVAYDGTDCYGWQKTKTGLSIEGCLQNALKKLFQMPLSLQAASRTDAGVHAEGQIVNFFAPSQRYTDERLMKSLNELLPQSIRILSIEGMPNTFHPTLDAVGKEYHYYLCLSPVQLPQYRNTSWHLPGEWNLKSISLAMKAFLGHQDFTTFCNFRKGTQGDPYCTLYDLQLHRLESERLKIVIIGDHFLYKMVRNLVGTLAFVGKGKLRPCDIPGLLSSKARPRAGVTAPAHGLFLAKIYYDKKDIISTLPENVNDRTQ